LLLSTAWFLPTKKCGFGQLAPSSRAQNRAEEAFLPSQEGRMDWDQIEKSWKQSRGHIKEKWDKLTDDDLNAIDGQRNRLEDRIHQRYGFAADHVRKEVDDWLRWQSLHSRQVRSAARTDLGQANE
jgi:uncharacterized protein YjbJ (UPF0337 family)